MPRNPDYAAINDAVKPAIISLLRRWLPDGKILGREYVAKNPRRADRNPGSFKICIVGSKAGRWADFATGDRGGDIVSLLAYLSQISQLEAANKLARFIGEPS